MMELDAAEVAKESHRNSMTRSVVFSVPRGERHSVDLAISCQTSSLTAPRSLVGKLRLPTMFPGRRLTRNHDVRTKHNDDAGGFCSVGRKKTSGRRRIGSPVPDRKKELRQKEDPIAVGKQYAGVNVGEA